MKTISITSILVSLLCFTFSSSEVRAERGRAGRHTAPPTTTSYREPAEVMSTGGGGGMRFGFGFATYGGVNNGDAISTLFVLAPQHSLQVTLAFGSSSPFQFGGGGMYRFTFIGNQDLGFHGGIGFNLGTAIPAGGAATSFFMNLALVGGFQFNLGGAANNVYLSFDGGPLFHVTPSPFQFSMSPLSALMGGGAIHYVF